MELLKTLKAKYDGQPLSTIETDISKFKKELYTSQKSMVDALWYIEKLERHKEDPAYRKSSFSTYLEDRFSMKLGTYFGLRRAYHNFEAEAVKYGPGLIQSIGEKCGSERVRAVLSEINLKDSKLKKPITRTQMQVIIDRNLKAKTKAEDPKPEPDWRAKFEAEHRLRMVAQSDLKEAREQIRRLRDTVLRLKAKQHSVDKVFPPGVKLSGDAVVLPV